MNAFVIEASDEIMFSFGLEVKFIVIGLIDR